jgi:hypothetical protein
MTTSAVIGPNEGHLSWSRTVFSLLCSASRLHIATVNFTLPNLIDMGRKQGDALSQLLFNIALKYAIKKDHEN